MQITAVVDEQKCISCIGCKLCVWACPDPNTIRYIKAKKKIVIDPQRCKGCGLCEAACPVKYIALRMQERELGV
ncbi:4Fe-4S binding protein [Thermodesulfovibrionales bacterium]|nr:4Fe-4S binding protein [Thermodesulfovibrionales bacterium]MCL0051496.1 4Fe-4S binding protein [Thermodesulfovibrionales bacterium]MCL0061457.1 4Fe-4S binding protein [Thermodesulfovibrionales bacterium]MCL0066539.1 4Fe-4S binding protein [Thermodesulfovibrionales bacterium]MCL0084999.1 4Fe-4S binding protein [Thermodesulfovibrionales bacterium]